jgi:sarcosine dehydrogenase
MNSMGMMLGGGLGRELATWICDGSPSVDLFAFDPARFHPQTVTDRKYEFGHSSIYTYIFTNNLFFLMQIFVDRWVEDRSHESYAKTYSIVFPFDEPLAGRGKRK